MLTGAALIRSPWGLGGMVDICILCSSPGTCVEMVVGEMLVASRAKAGGDQGTGGPRSRSKPIFAGMCRESAPLCQ